MTLAVTGASGFFGTALEPHLAARAPVRALFRRRTPVSDAWSARGHTVVFGDLDDDAALAALVDGVEIVYHCAARMGKDDPAASRRVNVTGTERLARAARAAGVHRLVYVSSISVYAATRTADGVITEAVVPRHTETLNPYSATKYAGETVVRTLAERGEGPAYTIIRPTNVYGPGGRSWVEDWIRRLDRIPIVLGGNIAVDLVHVDDVALALLQAGETPQAAGEVLHIGHDTITLRAYGDRIGTLIGRRIHHLPDPADWLARVLIERMYRLVKGDRPSLSLTRAVRYPHAKAEQVIGYRPQVTLTEGFVRLAEWYQTRARGA